jgi:hypothetical protein
MFGLRRTITAVLALLLALAACGDGAADDIEFRGESFIGTVDGTDAFIAIGIHDGEAGDDEVVVYVCNGDEEIAAWFTDTADDPTSFTLTSNTGEVVTGELVDGVFSGDFTRTDGSVHSYTATAMTGDDAGVYRTGADAAAEGIVAIWVIDNGGDERGAVLVNGSFRTATSFSRTFTFGGFTFAVSPIVGMNGIIAPSN